MPGMLSVEQEEKRLEALQRYRVLDSSAEQVFDEITKLAALVCGVPVSLITFLDRDRQWIKSAQGTEVRETPLSHSFCLHTVEEGHTVIIEDALTDPRVRANPVVTSGPKIRFYAGAPIVEGNGHVLGAVCVLDTEPRHLNAQQIAALETLARRVMSLLEQRRSKNEPAG